MKRIDNDLIEQLYNEFETPEHVKNHCKGVTDCAMKIATALNGCGFELDLELIYGAGMVHDMARTFERHDLVGAEKLFQLGFYDESDIVRVHMRYGDYHPVESLTECDLIVISDRLVIEGDFVGVDKRYDYIEEKARRLGFLDENGKARLRRDRQKLKDLISDIESVIGRSIDEL
ncbi:MAG: hypothetical protein IKR67_03245 [Lachnospiraceae bacterium]|nr:hypothetical protein [Lachnospiraceae bacterium]